jgi:protein gp37
MSDTVVRHANLAEVEDGLKPATSDEADQIVHAAHEERKTARPDAASAPVALPPVQASVPALAKSDSAPDTDLNPAVKALAELEIMPVPARAEAGIQLVDSTPQGEAGTDSLSSNPTALNHPYGDHCLRPMRLDGRSWILDDRALAAVKEDPTQQRFFVSDLPDLLFWLPFEDIEKFLSGCGEASQHVFLLVTDETEKLLEFEAWFKEKGGKWPSNLCLGVPVGDATQAQNISDLAKTSAAHKWIFFYTFKTTGNGLASDPFMAIPLAIEECKPELIVVSGRIGTQDGMSPGDLEAIARASDKEGSCFFFSPVEMRPAFECGDVRWTAHATGLGGEIDAEALGNVRRIASRRELPPILIPHPPAVNRSASKSGSAPPKPPRVSVAQNVQQDQRA